MTPYKGIIRISCREKKCTGGINPPLHTVLTQPEAGCINCDRARVEILDLEGKTIAEKKIVQGSRFKGSRVESRTVNPERLTNNK